MQSTSRRRFLQSTALSTLSLSQLNAFSAGKKPPNLLLILVDDMGYGDLGCYGAPDIATPNIDGLAREGVRLTQAYAFPVCTPTRCALMTGRYPARCPNLEWALYAGIDTTGLQPNQITIAKMLQHAGYHTGLMGKWHLGARPEWAPNQHGFDEFFGILSGNVDHFKHIESTGQPDLFENTTPIQEEGYLTDLITERSVDFIKQNQDEPFFLYVAYNAPHWPIQGPDDKDKEIIPGENWIENDRETYIEMVERIDWGVGKILKQLEDSGLNEETLVVFLSDNGGDRSSRNHPLSGQKGSLDEGGIRVPCIVRWPGEIPAGTESQQPTIVMDLTVSLLHAAQVNSPRPLEGINILPYISGQRAPIEQTFVWRDDMHDRAAVRWGDWKWLRQGEQEWLFHLKKDPQEQNDVKDEFFDIVYWMRDIYADWQAEMPYRQTLFGNELRNISHPDEGAKKES